MDSFPLAARAWDWRAGVDIKATSDNTRAERVGRGKALRGHVRSDGSSAV